MSGISPIKGLYLAKSIEEIQKLGLVQRQKPDLLVKENLSGTKECENGDQEKSYVPRRNEALKTVRKLTEVQKFGECENLKLKREVQSAKEIHSSKTCMDEKMSKITNQRIVEGDMLKSEKESFKDSKELTMTHANNSKFEVENRNLTESKFTPERNKMQHTV